LQGRDIANALLAQLSATSKDDALGRLAQLSKQAEMLNRISGVLPGSRPEDLLNSVKQLTEDNRRLKSEHERISALVGPDGGTDAAKAIREIIDRQKSMDGQMDAAATFVSELVGVLSGRPSSPTRLAFPLKKSIEDKLKTIVINFKARADRDRQQVEDLLVHAHVLGYEGDSILEACDHIAERKMETERQSTLVTVSKELGTVRSVSVTEKETYERDKSKSREKISKLTESITRQMETQRGREEEFVNEKAQLMKEIRDLKADLDTERRVREELGRIGAGLSSDKGYLRSKLSKNELRLLDFAERMAESDRAAAEVHEKQRRDREALIGTALASKSQHT
jgi:hypothetical protein